MPRVAVVAFSVALSALSVRLVEDPIRHSRPLAAVPARSLGLGAALVLVVALVGWTARSSVGRLDGGVEAAAPQLVAATTISGAPTSVVGAASAAATTTTVAGAATTSIAPASTTVAAAVAIEPPSSAVAQLVAAGQNALRNNSSAGGAAVPSNLQPSLRNATQRSKPYQDGCVNVAINDSLQPCEYGVAGGPTMLLFGDSHAAQWFEPVERYALQHGYRLVVLLKMGCPVADVHFSGQVLPYTCPPWRDRAIAWMAQHQPALVVVANSYVQYDSDADEWATGSATTFGRIADAVDAPVVVFGDNPASPVEVPVCLSAHLDDASACDVRREKATRPDLVAAEYAAARAQSFTFVDTTEWFCTDDNCPAIVGNILVLRDETHITAPMALYLQPLVDAVLAAA